MSKVNCIKKKKKIFLFLAFSQTFYVFSKFYLILLSLNQSCPQIISSLQPPHFNIIDTILSKQIKEICQFTKREMKEKTYACSLKNISCINLSSLLSINNYATIMLLGKYSATLKPIFTYIKVNCPPKEPRILLVHPSQ